MPNVISKWFGFAVSTWHIRNNEDARTVDGAVNATASRMDGDSASPLNYIVSHSILFENHKYLIDLCDLRLCAVCMIDAFVCVCVCDLFMPIVLCAQWFRYFSSSSLLWWNAEPIHIHVRVKRKTVARRREQESSSLLGFWQLLLPVVWHTHAPKPNNIDWDRILLCVRADRHSSFFRLRHFPWRKPSNSSVAILLTRST